MLHLTPKFAIYFGTKVWVHWVAIYEKEMWIVLRKINFNGVEKIVEKNPRYCDVDHLNSRYCDVDHGSRH